MYKTRALIAFAALCVVALTLAPTAAAHKTAYTADGKIKIVWGFLNEPAVTWTKTGLDLIITDNATGAPILGATDTVEVHLKRGQQEIHLEDLATRFGAPGSYSQALTLTQPGIYAINVHGTLNGSAVDMDIEGAHAVEAIEETFFPATNESPFEAGDAGSDARIAALEARIAALEAEAKTASETPAAVTTQAPTGGAPVPGLSLALLAIGGVVVALTLRRRA